MYAYAGKVLTVDLSTGVSRTEELDEGIARDFVGSCGISARLTYNEIPPRTDPLGPENAIIFGAGALCGTPLAAPRFTAMTKFPLTGAITFGCSGMGFGTRLKRAGYDHLLVRGLADRPVYVKILNGHVEIRDAAHLWGRPIPETTEELWRTHGRGDSVIAIGQAGENLVKISLALVDGIASLGKGGLGAVMGSKNLKAIMVGGNNSHQLAAPERFRELVAGLPRTAKADPQHVDYMDNPELLKRYGKIPFFATGVKKTNGVVYKNWTEMYPADEAIERYGFEPFQEKVRRYPVACPGCNHPCKDILEIVEGEYAGMKVRVSSTLGRIRDLGIRCGAGSIDKVIKLVETANRYGVDCHSFAPLMDFVVDLYERGIVTQKDTDGLALRRDFDTTQKLLEQVAMKRGIGAVMGEGSLGIIKRFGAEWEELSCHVKNLEPQADPRERRFSIEAFGEFVNPRGATQQPAHSGGFRVGEGFSQSTVRAYWERVGIPPDAMERIMDVPQGYNTARLTAHAEDFYGLLTSLGICNHRTNLFTYRSLAELYAAATGFEVDASDMRQAAERIWDMVKALNVREGFSRKDDRIPPKWVQPLKTVGGRELPPLGTEGKIVSAADVSRLLDDYYDERGWTISEGVPTKEKLDALGLSRVAQDPL